MSNLLRTDITTPEEISQVNTFTIREDLCSSVYVTLYYNIVERPYRESGQFDYRTKRKRNSEDSVTTVLDGSTNPVFVLTEKLICE